MSTWSELVQEFQEKAPELRGAWIKEKQSETLAVIGSLRGGRHVVFYASGFMQKPQIPANYLSITHEDLNGLMSALHGMTWEQGLTLVLHTPGGNINATESIVAYLRSKFASIEVIVPTLAMSAGTMISLACERVVLAHHSQLGPIDPQMTYGGKTFSARAVVSQFETAKLDIVGDSVNGIQGDTQMAHLWVPILQSLAPSLIQEAKNALEYSEEMVARWAKDYMFAGQSDAEDKGKKVAHHFNDASLHKSHGHRIGRDEARLQGVVVEDLEDTPDLQEAVLTLYHLATIAFDNSPVAKLIIGDNGNTWIKNFVTPEQLQAMQQAATLDPPSMRPGIPNSQPNRADRRGRR
jgi:hypothetical protein